MRLNDSRGRWTTVSDVFERENFKLNGIRYTGTKIQIELLDKIILKYYRETWGDKVSLSLGSEFQMNAMFAVPSSRLLVIQYLKSCLKLRRCSEMLHMGPRYSLSTDLVFKRFHGKFGWQISQRLGRITGFWTWHIYFTGYFRHPFSSVTFTIVSGFILHAASITDRLACFHDGWWLLRNLTIKGAAACIEGGSRQRPFHCSRTGCSMTRI